MALFRILLDAAVCIDAELEACACVHSIIGRPCIESIVLKLVGVILCIEIHDLFVEVFFECLAHLYLWRRHAAKPALLLSLGAKTPTHWRHRRRWRRG